MSGGKYVPPHRRKQDVPCTSSKTPLTAFESQVQHVRCINLHTRYDKWQGFIKRCKAVGHGLPAKVIRFNAIVGEQVREGPLMDDVQQEWDTTMDDRYCQRNVPPGRTRYMSNGEIGCALSHVALWRELAAMQGNGSTTTSHMLILEDDCAFAKDRFVTCFEKAWRQLPSDWAIFYLGFSDRGERVYIESLSTDATHEKVSHRWSNPTDPTIRVYRPEYGYHTHAYMITQKAAQRLLENLPVQGPIDVWLADHQWFDLPVYAAVIANQGWKLPDGSYEGKPLVTQVRGAKSSSDVPQSAR